MYTYAINRDYINESCYDCYYCWRGEGGVEVGYLTALAGRLKPCKFRLKIFILHVLCLEDNENRESTQVKNF